MHVPIQKIKAMVLFFASHTDPRLLGKVKLMKLFYFADFLHVKNFACPITYDDYVHLEHGPVPSTILNLVSAVETDPDNAMLSDVMSVEIKDGSLLKRIIPTNEFSEDDAKYFTPNELKIMKAVCERFFDKTAKFIEEASHKEAAWKTTKELEEIPYELAVEDPDCVVNKEDVEMTLSLMKR